MGMAKNIIGELNYSYQKKEAATSTTY